MTSRTFITLGVLLSLAYCSLCAPTENNDEKCEDLKMKFNLYTKKNPVVPQVLEISSDMKNAIKQSNFDAKNENKILIHGFSDSYLDEGFQSIKDHYLQKGDYNVWIFDWSIVAAGPPMNYEKVTTKMEFTGKCMSDFVKEISSITEAGDNAIHLIGHSLGAHMTGYIANKTQNYQFPRITGLDPAFPLFRNGQKEHRVLCKDDAKFVDILHTSGQKFGETDALGHADFYLNGGFNQPRCSQLGNVCNHMSVLTYFAESINSTIGFYGYSCPGIDYYMAGQCPLRVPDTKMGEDVDKSTTGTYIVMTNAVPPFARGKKL